MKIMYVALSLIHILSDKVCDNYKSAEKRNYMDVEGRICRPEEEMNTWKERRKT